MKSTGERLSPCGDPMDVSNSADVSDFTLMVSLVSARSVRTSRSSSSSQLAFDSVSRICWRFIVSKALDMSMPIL